MSEALLEIRGLTAGYGDVPILTGIDLTVGTGEIVALVGSNGAGKTTLLRAVSRTIKAGGVLRFAGADVLSLKPETLFARGLVQVPEGRQLFARMSVAENLAMGAYRRRDSVGIAASLGQVFDLFPILQERHSQMAGSLSGGEQQMCAIGRALMAAPKLLMIDEMSLGLAPIVVDRLLDVLVKIRGQGVPILMVEQDVFAALSIADRGYVLEHGRIVQAASSETLKHDPALQKAYLGADETS
ncbi:MAG TPA: ABC transporter ATP-binding protein [Stellaceae bacterium]|jgi:branched-chain amino acid transport system ATP-binding protein|nr:ABC transporter ATP-binding protein [Stellaceae bacterium]